MGCLTLTLAAIDLGATSGRVIQGEFDGERISYKEVHRFDNGPIPVPFADEMRFQWDYLHLWSNILTGLAKCDPLDSIGIDTWAVDFGMLGHQEELLANPFSYRDPHFEARDFEKLFKLNGLQRQNFNTIYQIQRVAERQHGLWESSRSIMLLPDLISHQLGAGPVCEVTNASTTGLLDPRTRKWSPKVFSYLEGIDVEDKLPPLVEPGSIIGHLDNRLADFVGRQHFTADPPAIAAVGSHDTASAVVAVPAEDDNFLFISCGTWSLVGVELEKPLINEAVREANFTNELGAFGRTRFLKNIMGLWVFNQCFSCDDFGHLLSEAATIDVNTCPVIDINDERLFQPGNMRERVLTVIREQQQVDSVEDPWLALVIVKSLAYAYADAIEETEKLTGKPIEKIHLVSGGMNNHLLCQLTADVCERDVITGPSEATALGNFAMNLVSRGDLENDPQAVRRVISNSVETTVYTPRKVRK